jgi:hypothetical protein
MRKHIMSFQATLDAYIAAPTLANAKRVVANDTHAPLAIATLPAEYGVHLANARRDVADARNPAKLRAAMQRELRARYPGMNIEVI